MAGPVPPARCLRGINIQRPWARMLLEGVKTVEIRNYQSKGYLNQDLWLVGTPAAVAWADPSRRKVLALFVSAFTCGTRTGRNLRAASPRASQVGTAGLEKAANGCLRVACGLSPDATESIRFLCSRGSHWFQGGLAYRRLRNMRVDIRHVLRGVVTLVTRRGFTGKESEGSFSRCVCLQASGAWRWLCGRNSWFHLQAKLGGVFIGRGQ